MCINTYSWISSAPHCSHYPFLASDLHHFQNYHCDSSPNLSYQHPPPYPSWNDSYFYYCRNVPSSSNHGLFHLCYDSYSCCYFSSYHHDYDGVFYPVPARMKQISISIWKTNTNGFYYGEKTPHCCVNDLRCGNDCDYAKNESGRTWILNENAMRSEIVHVHHYHGVLVCYSHHLLWEAACGRHRLFHCRHRSHYAHRLSCHGRIHPNRLLACPSNNHPFCDNYRPCVMTVRHCNSHFPCVRRRHCLFAEAACCLCSPHPIFYHRDRCRYGCIDHRDYDSHHGPFCPCHRDGRRSLYFSLLDGGDLEMEGLALDLLPMQQLLERLVGFPRLLPQQPPLHEEEDYHFDLKQQQQREDHPPESQPLPPPPSVPPP
mmetsp:Transcript_7625/g.17260  ORF Transcript_7625/g.17260 Transcript_7625/m.17260 type:complete len:373 (-) Transcript_7625:659-1777(-)